ncbi:MAG: pantetheine-phosphate adenylyltransferase [Candidatus Thermoplasmatota archaeon]|nr:pantetheine-phosphate adenylyltransferase [Candidatus Thermoplasmatota archaeon]
MKVCLGGTFGIIHEGHEALLKKAFEMGKEITIGITTDEMAKKLGKTVTGYDERKKNLEKFFVKKFGRTASITPLDDPYGPAAYGDFDAIIVSPETLKRAKEINEMRRKKNMRELKIIEIPFTLADDGIPISSSRIKNREIKDGRRMKPLVVKISSSNIAKISATKKAFKKFFGYLEIRFEGIELKTKPQPFDEEIMKGAIHRAKKAISMADYGIGIESGIREEDGICMVEQYCAIIDKTGYITRGKSPAFECPEWILNELKKKEMKEIIPFKNEGEKENGAIWYLSKGKISREEIIEKAVEMALLPRIGW